MWISALDHSPNGYEDYYGSIGSCGRKSLTDMSALGLMVKLCIRHLPIGLSNWLFQLAVTLSCAFLNSYILILCKLPFWDFLTLKPNSISEPMGDLTLARASDADERIVTVVSMHSCCHMQCCVLNFHLPGAGMEGEVSGGVPQVLTGHAPNLHLHLHPLRLVCDAVTMPAPSIGTEWFHIRCYPLPPSSDKETNVSREAC